MTKKNMNSQTIEKTLEQIGLSKSEAKIYLASLSLGPGTVINIGQKSGLTRQMVYTLLPALAEKGLIKEITINKKTLYQALPPERLKDEVEVISKKIDSLIPLLKSKQAENSAVPTITVYENPLAMREWYKNYMNEARKDEELLVWSQGKLQNWYSMDTDFYDRYLNFSEKVGIKTYVLLPDTFESLKYQDTVGKKVTKHKLVRGWGERSSDKWVWRDQVCYLTIRENATNMIVLQSKSLADLERADFWSIWKAN